MKFAGTALEWKDTARHWKRKSRRLESKIRWLTIIAGSLAVYCIIMCWTNSRSFEGAVIQAPAETYHYENSALKACSDGKPCDRELGVAEKVSTAGSFVIDDRVGISRADLAMLERWAEHHKRDFDRLFVGTERVKLDPPIRIGIESSSPGRLSGNAVGGGFSCGHDAHVFGPIQQTYRGILRHEISHCLIYRYFGVFERFIHEGTSAWFENDYDYNDEVHKAIHNGQAVSLPALFSGRMHRDHFGMYRVCASMVDYLVKSHGAKKYGTFLRTAGSKGLTSSLRSVYNYTPESLEVAWRGRLCRR